MAAQNTKERDIYQGGSKEVADQFIALARASDNLVLCSYKHQAKNVTQSKLFHGQDGVEGQYKLLACLKPLHATLSFTKKMHHGRTEAHVQDHETR